MFLEEIGEWARAGALVGFPLLVILAAVKDAATMTIPNWISAWLIGAFGVISWFLIPSGEVGAHLIVGVIVLTICFGMFALNWIGGGDAKLIAAVALWMGVDAIALFLVWTALAGGALSLGLLSVRRAMEHSPIALGEGPVGRLLSPRGDIPYGLAIAAGALLAFPKSGLI